VSTTTVNVRLDHMEAPDQPVRRFTADEAIRMVELGILGEDEHLELLDGALVEMSPKGPEHDSTTANLADRLRGAYPGAGRVREEKSLAIDPYNLPEPDIVVLGSDSSAYVRRHPSGPETLLVVELSWSSQRRDRRKASIYAAGGSTFTGSSISKRAGSRSGRRPSTTRTRSRSSWARTT
jgi:Uma2 family endonuclease